MRMSQVARGRLSAIIGTVLVVGALPAVANTFAVFPDTPGGNFAAWNWSIAVDSGGPTANPTLIVMTGQTYSFIVNTSGLHPFYIDQAPGLGGTNPYPVGPALSANAVESPTTITMNLPADAPETLYYACGLHEQMNGTITVVHDLVFRSNFE